MTTDPQLMPDFRDNLEQALYRRASLPAASSGRVRLRRPDWRVAWPAGLASVTAAVVAAVVLVLSGGHPTAPAFATPLILSQPTQAVPPGLTPGAEAVGVLGPSVTFDRAVAIEAFGSTGYLLKGPTGWCISAPDPAGASAADSVTRCALTADLKRIGLGVVGGGSSFLAIIPPTAPTPTIAYANGATGELPPNSLGVVAATDLKRGDVIVLHGVDGSSLRFPIAR